MSYVKLDDDAVQEAIKILRDEYIVNEMDRKLIETIGAQCYKAGIRQALYIIRMWLGDDEYNELVKGKSDEQLAGWFMCYEAVDDIDRIIDRYAKDNKKE